MPEPPDELDRIFGEHNRSRERVADSTGRRRPLPLDKLLSEVKAAAADAGTEMENRLEQAAASREDVIRRVGPISRPQLEELLQEVRQQKPAAAPARPTAWEKLRQVWEEWRRPWLMAIPALVCLMVVFVLMRGGRQNAPGDTPIVLAMGIPVGRGAAPTGTFPTLPMTFKLRLPDTIQLVESNGNTYAGQLVEDPAREETIETVRKRTFALKAHGTNALGQSLELLGTLRINIETTSGPASARVIYAVLEQARAVVGTNQIAVPRLELLRPSPQP
jgi:hypothetical protein